MHRLAMGALAGLAALAAGCLGEKTHQCNNGATCAYDEVCTEITPITPDTTLCGTPRLVDACENQADFSACDFTTGQQDGTCRSGVCTECVSVDVSGCEVKGWNRMTTQTNVRLFGVWVGGPGQAIAVGEQRTVIRYDGAAWRATTAEAAAVGSDLKAVWGGSSVYAVTAGGEVLQSQGEDWTVVHSVAPQQLAAIAGAGPTVMAVGFGGTVAAFNGGWSTQQVSPPAPLFGVWVADANNAIAVGSQGIIFRFKDGTWTVDRGAQTGEPALRAVWGRSPTDVYAVGDRLTPAAANILHYEGGTWVRVATPPTNRPFLNGIWGTGADLFAAGQFGALDHFNGTAWSETMFTSDPDLFAISGSSIDNVMAVGVNGLIVRYTGLD